ncbi:MAG: ABC transporter ATP-binding protein [Bacteroidia bacterium]|nr:ABC transporter ATP-binding protein [Bacteroidia bacterium]
MIVGHQIKKSYGKLSVLKGVDVSIGAAEVVSIVGASGAGKSTLLQILGTLDKNFEGSLKIADVEVRGLKDKKLSAFRNQKIGFIFQFHQLLPEFTALENACLPAWINGTTKKDAEKRARELFEILGISSRESHQPRELSGGEQQRVAVARALINNPAVVFADEPSGNLDSANAKELHNLFFTLRTTFKQTFVIVTHNEELANLADRKLVMKDGLIVNETTLETFV